MTTPLIRVQNIVKTYGREGGRKTEVLRELSLDIPAGRFVALMGSSGSGKSTLLNLIGGLDLPDSGTIEVDGRDIHRLSDDERSLWRMQSLGFVFQFFNLLNNLTVRENIALPLLFLGQKEKEANAAAAESAQEVGLGDKLDRYASQLSGGEMQRVALARAIVHQPRLLLADEPTGNLDTRTGTEILELIRHCAENHGATVLMATHDQKSTDICDDVIHVTDGRITEAAGV